MRASDRPAILIAEDDSDLRDGLITLLEGEGFEVAVAANGLEALARLGADPLPDLLLLDLEMPLMDGTQVLARIQANPRLAGLRVIVFSASRRNGRLSESCIYLAKPFDLEQILELIERTLASPVSPGSFLG